MGDAGGDVFAQGGAVLEAVSGAAAYQPDILKIRVAVDQEVAVGGVLVLAEARFDDGGILQGWKALGKELADGR